MRPREIKRDMNEAFAARFGRKRRKSVRRKLRHARVEQRELAWLITHGALDTSDTAAPLA